MVYAHFMRIYVDSHKKIPQTLLFTVSLLQYSMRKMGLEGIVQLLITDRKGVSNSSILTVTKV